jgi:NAD(P)-dependent dehydrogenase (short-subunit alcohol dehydrogenase family)
MQTLKDQVVIITGAVGNLGAATVRAFQNAGAKMVLVDRSPDRVREMFADLADSPLNLFAGGIDLSDLASLDTLIGQALAKFGRIDALVNTVGGYRGGKPVHEADLADWDFLFKVNVHTTLLCCRAVVPQMLKQRGGKIVNVAGRAGLNGSAGYAAYSASKSAALRLTESLADELKTSNVNVNCVMPGTMTRRKIVRRFPMGIFQNGWSRRRLPM